MDKYEEALGLYNTTLDDEQVKQSVEDILHKHLAENCTADVYKFLFHCIDLTTLRTDSMLSSGQHGIGGTLYAAGQ